MFKLRFLIGLAIFTVLATVTLSQPLSGDAAYVVTGYHLVSGFIRYKNQNPVSGVKVFAAKSLKVTPFMTFTDGNGYFEFTLTNGTYGVRPIKAGLTFSPKQRLVTVRDADVAGVNFTAN